MSEISRQAKWMYDFLFTRGRGCCFKLLGVDVALNLEKLNLGVGVLGHVANFDMDLEFITRWIPSVSRIKGHYWRRLFDPRWTRKRIKIIFEFDEKLTTCFSLCFERRYGQLVIGLLGLVVGIDYFERDVDRRYY